MRYLIGAVEDEPSEAILRKIVASFDGALELSNVHVKRGWTFLFKNIAKYAQASQRYPVIVLTDLDDRECAPAMVAEWRSHLTFNAPELVLRVAVREIESWILADEVASEELFGRRNLGLPPQIDDVLDPKAWLLRAASVSAREVRSDLVREESGVLRRGVGYNSRLLEHIGERWQVDRAVSRSESLRRAVEAIERLARSV